MMVNDIDWSLLKDRSVIITGGASGLGEQTSRKFHSYGAFITIADVQDELGQKLTAELGERTTFIHCDTTSWEESAAAFKHAANFSPSKNIDVVVLFAGVDGERRGEVHPSLTDASPLHYILQWCKHT
jgi:5'-hydroxyaverantin dehydrogenase